MSQGDPDKQLPSPAVPEVVTTPPSGPPDGYPQPTTPVSPGSDSSSQVVTKPDRQDHVQSQPSSLPPRDAQNDPLKDSSPSTTEKARQLNPRTCCKFHARGQWKAVRRV